VRDCELHWGPELHRGLPPGVSQVPHHTITGMCCQHMPRRPIRTEVCECKYALWPLCRGRGCASLCIVHGTLYECALAPGAGPWGWPL
jgi:hypothetical protein